MNKLHVIADQYYNWPKEIAEELNLELNFSMCGTSCSPLYWLYAVYDIDYQPGDKIISLMPSAERETTFKEPNYQTEADNDRVVHLTASDSGSHNNLDRIQFVSSLAVKSLEQFSKDKDAYFYVFQDQIWGHKDGYHHIPSTELSKFKSIEFVEDIDPNTVGPNNTDPGLSPMNMWLSRLNSIPYKEFPVHASPHTFTDIEGKSLFTKAILDTLPEVFFTK
ncbi:MAG: hypothetical protein CMA64_09030 [Euryarchaeota archaeon]|nr:hypothetical protein [Euryarchaeota archaeon]